MEVRWVLGDAAMGFKLSWPTLNLTALECLEIWRWTDLV